MLDLGNTTVIKRVVYYHLATVDVDPLTDHDGRTDSSKPLIPDTTGEHSVELDFLANPSADISEPICPDDSVSVDSFESQPSSPLITDNNTTTTRTFSNRTRRKFKLCLKGENCFYCWILIFCAVAPALLSIGLILHDTLAAHLAQ